MGSFLRLRPRSSLGSFAGFASGTCLVLALLVPNEAFSQAPDVDFRGVVTVETAFEPSSDGFQKGGVVFDPQVEVDFGDAGRLTLIGRLRADFVDEIEPGSPGFLNAVRSPVSDRAFLGDIVDLELREAYFDTEIGNVFLRLGKQQVVWGEADGLRVIDLINPLSFREFIIGDFEDRRIPTWIANVEANIGPLTAQFLWIPDRTFDEIPPGDGAFAITSPLFVPEPPAGFAGTVTIAALDRPDRFILDDDYGVRLNGFFGGWDLSLNYLYHFRDEQVLTQSLEPGGDLLITPGFERSHLIGGTASNAFGKFTLRTELGFSTDRFFLTDDIADADGIDESDEVSYVIGLDYQANADTIISAQLFQSYLTSADRGVIRGDLDTTLSLLVSREFQNDRLTAEALYLQSVDNGDGLLQLDASYELRSNLTLKAGADIFFGTADGVFGQFRGADRLRLGVEFSF